MLKEKNRFDGFCSIFGNINRAKERANKLFNKV